MTGAMALGIAIDARSAASTGPSWNHTSRCAIRSVATAVNGMGRSSMRAPASRSRTTAMTFSALMSPAALIDGSSRRITSRWLSPVTHAV